MMKTTRTPSIRALMALAMTSIALVSGSAFAAPTGNGYGPDNRASIDFRYFDEANLVNDFQVDLPSNFNRGSRVNFTVRGEPRSRVAVQIQAVGINRTVNLTETRMGIYQGSYTLSSNDFDRPTFKAQINKGRMSSSVVATPDERRKPPRWDDRDNNGYRPVPPPSRPTPPIAQVCYTCGVIESVETVDRRVGNNHNDSNNAVGLIGGAIVGGLIGNQVGGGSGRTAATAVGAVGGGYLGNEISRNQNNGNSGEIIRSYVIHVRMDDGSVQNLNQSQYPNLPLGERVRIENNQLVPIRR